MSPRNATEDRYGNRTYVWREEKYHSVTTINNAIGKPFLVNWAARETAKYAVVNFRQLGVLLEPNSEGEVDDSAAIDWLKGAPYRETERAANVGTEIHAAIEAHVLGKPRPAVALPLQPHMDGFYAFLDQYEPTFELGLAEASVFNRSQRYAGTLDAIGSIDGRRLIFDWKSGKNVYPEVALQLAAYRHAEFVGMPDGSELPMPQVDGGACLHIPKTGDWKLLDVECGEEIFTAFQFVREVYRWSKVTSGTVLRGEYDRGRYAQPTLLEVAE